MPYIHRSEHLVKMWDVAIFFFGGGGGGGVEVEHVPGLLRLIAKIWVAVKAGLWTGPWTGFWTEFWTEIWTKFWTCNYRLFCLARRYQSMV